VLLATALFATFPILYPILGTEYIDTVTIVQGVEIWQIIGVASEAAGFDPFDGILG
jgi:hypothetical protein